MKKYSKLLLVSSLVIALSLNLWSVQNALAVPPVDGGAGDATKIGKVNCIYKSATGEFAPETWQVGVVIGTDKYFYVKPSTATPPTVPILKNMASATDTANRPALTYKEGTMTNRLFFSYQGAFTPDQLDSHGKVNLATIPFMVLSNHADIYTVSSDGTKYYPFDWANLNDTNMPVCTDATKKSVIPPSCTDGIKNQDETGIDTGGVCGTSGGPGDGGPGGTGGSTIPDTGTCTDGIKNGNEDDIDIGGSCEGGILSPGTSPLPRIQHIKSNNRPIEVDWHKDSTIPASFDVYLNQARKDWNLVRALKISINGSGWQVPMSYGTFYEGNSVAQWVGAESYASDGIHQYNPKVEFNKPVMDQYNLNGPEYMQFLICHELGHSLGAGHVNENNGPDPDNLGSCMDYSRKPGGGGDYGPMNNLHPSAVDRDELEKMYNHHDN